MVWKEIESSGAGRERHQRTDYLRPNAAEGNAAKLRFDFELGGNECYESIVVLCLPRRRLCYPYAILQG